MASPELLNAIKHGRKERANPGRDGAERWKYTYQGTVHVTDHTGLRKVFSFRTDGAHEEHRAQGSGCHTVLIVDQSASMRKNDVPGYTSRTNAVYECLAKDFVEAQLDTRDVVVTLIEMSDDARVVFEKEPLSPALAGRLRHRGKAYARSHGNYLPVLQKAYDIIAADAATSATFLILFLSDGAPSDQNLMRCAHGIQVWQPNPGGGVDKKGRVALQQCGRVSVFKCREATHERVKRECLAKIEQIGDVGGRDRTIMSTVAFGPPSEDFNTLKEMGELLPRGACDAYRECTTLAHHSFRLPMPSATVLHSIFAWTGAFQKLGVSLAALRTAFSSLSSSLSTLTTEGGSRSMTLRNLQVKRGQKHEQDPHVRQLGGWWLYHGKHHVQKYVYDAASQQLRPVPFGGGATGLAFFKDPFAEGVERYVYRCTEIQIPSANVKDWYDASSASQLALRRGPRLVAKEAKHEQNLGERFQTLMARTQGEAARLADHFNMLLGGVPAQQLTFLPVSVYRCSGPFSHSYPNGEAWELVEMELEGHFYKWNNNAGEVTSRDKLPRVDFRDVASSVAIGAIAEEDDEAGWDSDDTADARPSAAAQVDESEIHEVPQCFSHFSYKASRGKELVCDLRKR